MDTPTTIAPTPECGGIRVKGIVKWFDQTKGYGFIVWKELNRDVLLHKSVVESFGCTAVLDGAIVECEVTRKVISKPDGVVERFQALRLHSVEPAEAGSGSAGYGRKGPRDREILLDEPVGPAFEAECKWFNRPKGFGFLTCEKISEDIFVHMDVLRRFSVKELKPGQKVLVRAGRGKNGLMATEIHIIPESVTNLLPFRVVTAMNVAAE